MHRLLNLCLWQVLFTGLLLSSGINVSAQEASITIRGPKSTDVYPYHRYGPINSNDTLWKIATKLRPNKNVSMYQVMQSIFELNPNAFANNNINHLVNGEYIKVPSLADIQAIDENVARKKSQNDSKAWAEKVPAKAKEQKVTEKNASQKDLEAAKVEINEQLQTIETDQKGRLETIQRDVLDSIDGLQAILKENESLKRRLGDFNEQLTVMQNDVAKGQEVKKGMDEMLRLQQELLAKAEEREQQLLREREESFTSSIWFKVLLGVIPTLLIIGGLLLFLRKKQEKPEQAATEAKAPQPDAATESSKESSEPESLEDSLDDSLSLDGELSLDDELSIDLTEDDDSSESALFADDLDDSLSDELLDDDVIHLDDNLDNLDNLDDLDDLGDLNELEDISLDDDTEILDVDGESDELSGDLEVATDDDPDDGEALEGGALDQSDLDDLLSGLDSDDDELTEEAGEALENNELDQGDLDSLLDGFDEVGEDDEHEVSKEAKTATDEIPDDSDVTDPDDIDAILAGANNEAEEKNEQEIPDDADVTDPDDIEALLDSINSESPAVEAEAEPDAAEEIPDGADVTDPDDIDALLDSINSDSPAVEVEPDAAEQIPDGADVTDPDDIDALLDSINSDSDTVEAEAEPEAAEEIPDGADVTDPDDIDALLASINGESDTVEPEPEPEPLVEEAADEIPDGADVTDPDDIDALLESISANDESQTAVRHEITDQEELDAVLDKEVVDDLSNVSTDDIEEQSDEENDNSHKAMIDSFSEEYVAPFLNADFSDLTAKKGDSSSEAEQAETDEGSADDITNLENEDALESTTELDVDEHELDTDALTSLEEESVDEEPLEEPLDEPTPPVQHTAPDDIDIEALISDVQSASESDIDIGDDIVDSDFDKDIQPIIDDDTLSEMSGDFDESTLSSLLNDEKTPEEPIELSPDFTDSNVLADLLTDEESGNDEPAIDGVIEANEIDDIQELDSLDFDELLANIEESTTTSDDSFDLTDELDEDESIDIGDDLADGLDINLDDIEDEDEDEDVEVKEDVVGDNFVSVDSLLSDTLDISSNDEEPYNKTSIDVGLDEFPEFTSEVNSIDVDDDDNGVAAKLDLAKVYIEIGDKENAEIILQDVVKLGDAQQQFDAQQLLDSL